MMEISHSSLQEQIPYYLTQPQKDGLKQALKDFETEGKSVPYYTSLYKGELLQGDCWDSLQIIRFKDGERKNTKGILLSNSCDMSSENKRDKPMNVVFAPIVSLSQYERVLGSSGFSTDIVASKLASIRKQEVTSIFYLPKGGDLTEEYIAYLDDIHTIPIDYFDDSQKEQNLFTLSMFGFYLFLFKISVHFCRFHENVARDGV